MTVKRPRANVTFHPDLFHELETASSNTGLSISHIVDQLLGAHMQELLEFNDWMKHQDGESKERATHALSSYGPNDLITEMKRIDPTYCAPDAQQMAAGSGLFNLDEVADLRTMVAEWKAWKATQ